MNVIGMNEVIHLLITHTKLYSTLLTHNEINNEVKKNGKQIILSGDCTNEVVEETKKKNTSSKLPPTTTTATAHIHITTVVLFNNRLPD